MLLKKFDLNKILKMFGRRLLNNKHHRINNDSKPFINKTNYKSKIFDEEIKFNEEKEEDLPFVKENDNKDDFNKIPENTNNKNEVKEKKKSVIVNRAGNFLSFSSGITLNEENENEKRGIYDLDSTTGNFLKDNFSSQKYYEGTSKKSNDIDHFFAPLTQEDLQKINDSKKTKSKSNKFIPKEIDLDKFNQSNIDIINKYSQKTKKINNNDELEFNLSNEDDPYAIEDESSGEIKKIPKNKMKLINKLGIDLEDETELNKDIDNIIKDKVDRIKEVKQHQRKCLLVENLDGLYGKSQNPNDILRGIYDTLNDENNDSEYEEEIDKWENAQFKSGIKLNQLNLNNDFNSAYKTNEIDNNFKYQNLYDKLMKNKELEYDELINNYSQIVERDKSLLHNYVNKKNDYNIELNKILNNKKKLEDDLDRYIKQYNELKKFLIKIIEEKEDTNINDIDLDAFYVSD